MMRKHRRGGELLSALMLSLSMLLGAVPPPPAHALTPLGAPPAKAPTAGPRGRVRKSLTQLPASFEANAGQAGPGVKFLSRGARHTLLLGAGGATLALRTGGDAEGVEGTTRRRARGESARDRRAAAPSYQLIRMSFVGANPRPEVAGEGGLPGRVNYLVGRDPSKWRAGVPTYSGVRYRGLYPGVDLLFHGGDAGDRLEYDFVLAPGADHRQVRLRFDGAERLSLGRGGELLLHTKSGTFTQSAPVIYQHVGGARREVSGAYVLRGGREVGFRLGVYDPTAPLVIDPVLVYSTYFLSASKMALDPLGAVYAVGTAYAFLGDLPATPGAFQTTRRGDSDAFVAKLDADGTGLAYLTYLGGGEAAQYIEGEYGQDIAIDSAGNAYVTGLTYSKDFPVVGAFQPTTGGVGADCFVAKLNPTGSALVYSTYLGGTHLEWVQSIAVDAAGSAYVFGDTDSADFPVRNAVQPAIKSSTDLFVTKFAPDGKSLAYSTYLGGSEYEPSYYGDLAVDAAGAAYVVATTASPDFPVTPGSYQPAPKKVDGFIFSEATLTKIAPAGSAIAYSTYLGGTGPDYGRAVAVDAAGQAHVVGETYSEDFPTMNAPPPAALDPGGNGFAAKFNAAGSALVYSTYLTGAPSQSCGPARINHPTFCYLGQRAAGVAVDAAGNAYVTGGTSSANFPAPVDAIQPALSGPSDAFVVKLGPAGQSLYSTYLGGSSYEEGIDIHVDPAGTAYVLGGTSSDDFPTVNPYRDGFAREFDQMLSGFLSRLTEAEVPGQAARVQFDSATYEVGEGGRSARAVVTRTGDLSQEVSVDYATGDGTAWERSDYGTARGTLRFAPGESAKSFDIFVTDDNTVEGDESLSLTLHNLRGAAVLAPPASAALKIADDDERPAAANPIDSTEFFVRQHYRDFLSREPDEAGLRFWSDEIESCGADAPCRDAKRVHVSAAFFLSIEFQETGFLVERLYRIAFGVNVPYHSFVRDARVLGEGVVVGQGPWRQRLDANRRAYADEFVARASFRKEFPETLTAAQYVERLNARASGALSTQEFSALVAGLEAGTETRASVLLKVADDEDFRRREFAPAFVLMQYLGYLRRDPDEPGFQFWLNKLNSFGGDFIRAEMVKAFINSDEYRRRFHEPQKEAALGAPFALRPGETAVVFPDKLRVSILDIGFDSRCPRGTQCPSPGGVTILLLAVTPDGESAHIFLRIDGGVPRPHPATPPVSALGYNFRLLQLDPEPPYTPQSPPTEALLQIDKD